MLHLHDLILLSDIAHMTKDTLKELCTELGLPNEGSPNELIATIWPVFKEGNDRKLQLYEILSERIFAGRTSITWYHSTSDSFSGIKDEILKNSVNNNPFESVYIPEISDIGSEPILISAAEVPSKKRYILRYMYKTGVSREVLVDGIELRNKTATTTLVVDEDNGYIEVRSEPKIAGKIARSFAQLIKQQVTIEQTKVIASFGNDPEKFADALGGELIDTVGKPDLILEDFNEAHAQSVIKILTALDSYFEKEDISDLQLRLTDARQSLGEGFSEIPFTALILSGMEKVGMGVKGRDLRGTPLYDYLKTSLEQQGCYIRFNVDEDGVNTSHTIRIGLQSNSIYFMSQATEKAIDFVRQNIII